MSKNNLASGERDVRKDVESALIKALKKYFPNASNSNSYILFDMYRQAMADATAWFYQNGARISTMLENAEETALEEALIGESLEKREKWFSESELSEPFKIRNRKKLIEYYNDGLREGFFVVFTNVVESNSADEQEQEKPKTEEEKEAIRQRDLRIETRKKITAPYVQENYPGLCSIADTYSNEAMKQIFPELEAEDPVYKELSRFYLTGIYEGIRTIVSVTMFSSMAGINIDKPMTKAEHLDCSTYQGELMEAVDLFKQSTEIPEEFKFNNLDRFKELYCNGLDTCIKHIANIWGFYKDVCSYYWEQKSIMEVAQQ